MISYSVIYSPPRLVCLPKRRVDVMGLTCQRSLKSFATNTITAPSARFRNAQFFLLHRNSTGNSPPTKKFANVMGSLAALFTLVQKCSAEFLITVEIKP
jgi:hypothetical protein